MLNLFPELFTYQLVAPVILRVVLGIIVINLGYLKLSSERERWVTSLKTLHIEPAKFFVKILAYAEIIGGCLLIIGLYTQLVALIFVVIFGAEAYFESKEDLFFKRSFVFYLLLLAISASLLFLGAGFYAIDIPLL